MAEIRGDEALTLHETLVDALRGAARYNRADVAAPAAVLWTDEQRRWERVVSRLGGELPLLTLGDYDPERLAGPAIWLRCAVAGTLPGLDLPEGTPVIYLPGVSRADLRAIETCPKPLRPLAELQYRGVLFSQKSGRDWTPAAILRNRLGVEVSQDAETRKALARALPKLLDQPPEDLEAQAPLKAAYLDSLLVPDPERELLRWLDAPKDYRGRAEPEDPAAWESLRRICVDKYGFDPVSDGDITAGRLLGEADGPWRDVWRRFADAPSRYPNLPALLDRSRPEGETLFEPPVPYWPSDNREQEDRLREALEDLSGASAPEARSRLLALETEHGERRSWPWAELGEAPLARSLARLAALAEAAEDPLPGGAPEEQAARYVETGWRADWHALEALASVEGAGDSEAIRAAVEAVYRPWLEESARRFQRAVADAPLPSPFENGDSPEEPHSGVCILFTDGLRYDVARCLTGILEERGVEVDLDWRFSALPGVTATAKSAISPVGPLLEPGEDFDATVDGSKVTAASLRRLLRERGREILESGDEVIEAVSSGASGWTEFGDLDRLEHERGWRMARDLRRSVGEIADRAKRLLEAGWREVRVVTDHGWLLLPGGLPKADLPEHLTTVRKGRCARLKQGAKTDAQTVPWSLDPEVRVAVAPGIHAYEAGKQYEHGGLSLQECVIPILTARTNAPAANATISEVKWSGLRCKVRVENVPEGASVELRARAADPSTSITSAKPLKDGAASLPVADDTREFEAAVVVVLGPDGWVLAQAQTVVGG